MREAYARVHTSGEPRDFFPPRPRVSSSRPPSFATSRRRSPRPRALHRRRLLHLFRLLRALRPRRRPPRPLRRSRLRRLPRLLRLLRVRIDVVVAAAAALPVIVQLPLRLRHELVHVPSRAEPLSRGGALRLAHDDDVVAVVPPRNLSLPRRSMHVRRRAAAAAAAAAAARARRPGREPDVAAVRERVVAVVDLDLVLGAAEGRSNAPEVVRVVLARDFRDERLDVRDGAVAAARRRRRLDDQIPLARAVHERAPVLVPGRFQGFTASQHDERRARARQTDVHPSLVGHEPEPARLWVEGPYERTSGWSS
eukprot:31322-Pelagococcus_subviridis.AAC.5